MKPCCFEDVGLLSEACGKRRVMKEGVRKWQVEGRGVEVFFFQEEAAFRV